MVKFVNAKINLGLNIIKKRADGYHELSTLFYPVGLYNGTPDNPQPFCDILEINRKNSGKDDYNFLGKNIDCPLERNLVFKAVECFKNNLFEKKRFLSDKIFPVSVTLFKHIPDGAGLGGGSADASFALLMLNSFYKNIFSKTELINMAAGLGADCPFFIENSPVIASGIGEIMTPFPLNLDGFWALIVKPDIYISTKIAFAGISPRRPEIPISEIVQYPVSQWEDRGLRNDFEPHIFKHYPEVMGIKRDLKNGGALYSSMTGSGSSVYGIFRNCEEAERLRVAFSPLPSYIIKL